MTGLSYRFDELGKSHTSLRVGASSAAEYHPNLIIGQGAEVPIERERDQRRQSLGDKRHAVDHNQEDREDGGKRPGDNAAGLGMTATPDFEIACTRGDLRLCARIKYFEPRERARNVRLEPAVKRHHSYDSSP
jgi:hypothetical protein